MGKIRGWPLWRTVQSKEEWRYPKIFLLVHPRAHTSPGTSEQCYRTGAKTAHLLIYSTCKRTWRIWHFGVSDLFKFFLTSIFILFCFLLTLLLNEIKICLIIKKYLTLSVKAVIFAFVVASAVERVELEAINIEAQGERLGINLNDFYTQ